MLLVDIFLARHIFGKMDVIQCMYTVQIIPRTDKVIFMRKL